MTGTIPKGAVIYSRITPVAQLEAGDIITFNPPGSRPRSRTASSPWRPGPDGRPAFRTKGDFNETADPWNPITLNEPQQARYAFQVPLLGYVLAALGMRIVRIALIGLPARPHRALAALVAVAPGRRGGRAPARGRRRPARREEPGVSAPSRRPSGGARRGRRRARRASPRTRGRPRRRSPTSSQSTVTASVDGVSNWLHVYSQSGDPEWPTGYARRRGVNGVAGPPAATGQDQGHRGRPRRLPGQERELRLRARPLHQDAGRLSRPDGRRRSP